MTHSNSTPIRAPGCRCGATWTGLRIEHCTECHETFTGTTAGDKHRTGDHATFVGPDRRRCLTPLEMLGKGMAQNKRGQWTNGGTSPWAQAAEPEALVCNAEGIPHPAHEWDFGSGETFRCTGEKSERPGGDA